MTRKVAVIAGRGALPDIIVARLQAAGTDWLCAEPDGLDTPAPPRTGALRFRLERLVPFLDQLLEAGVTHVTFAGAVHRPRLDPALIDPRTLQLLPRIMAAMQNGDDATLREVLSLFEEWGLSVIGTAELCPELLPGPGCLSTRAPSSQDQDDAARAAEIVAALGAVDVGQGAVVSRRTCLAVEALPGTDAMLAHIATLRAPGALWSGHTGGVLLKAAKPAQDRRIDLPAIGPDTLHGARAAGLSGVAFAPGSVLLLEPAPLAELADALGLSLWAPAP